MVIASFTSMFSEQSLTTNSKRNRPFLSMDIGAGQENMPDLMI
jgi:hypothetical protein